MPQFLTYSHRRYLLFYNNAPSGTLPWARYSTSNTSNGRLATQTKTLDQLLIPLAILAVQVAQQAAAATDQLQ